MDLSHIYRAVDRHADDVRAAVGDRRDCIAFVLDTRETSTVTRALDRIDAHFRELPESFAPEGLPYSGRTIAVVDRSVVEAVIGRSAWTADTPIDHVRVVAAVRSRTSVDVDHHTITRGSE